MGKYSSITHTPRQTTTRRVHPIWRGIGFILVILLPILAYFTAIVLIDENSRQNWVTIPADLLAKGADPNLFIKIIGTVVFIFLYYSILTTITFIFYRLLGPSRYGPMDAPSEGFRGRKYQR